MFRSTRTPLSVPRLLQAYRRSIINVAPQMPTQSHGDLPSSHSPITPSLHFFNSVMENGRQIPTYRILDGVGKPLDGAKVPDIDEALARRIYENMLRLPIVDNILYNAQRQGKISFYMTSHGEEATITGAAAALASDDEVLCQYRELGVLLYRGFTMDAVMAQCFGNYDDTSTKGKQMPVHFGSKEFHYHTISSPLATQIPQAAGVGYALKRDPARRGKNCAAVFFGDGAASEGDFHAGMLLASTIPSPTLFIARNNGFAISTPATEQYYGDGIASRGPGYGAHTIRVDGNDVLAVYDAVREARKLCVEEGRAVLVEAMTYRVGHHSTSDDSFAYRPRQEVEEKKRVDNPLARMKSFLESRGWWSDAEEESAKARFKEEILRAFKKAETMKKPAISEMFKDVYAPGHETWMINEQREELKALVKKYGGVWEPWKAELEKFKEGGKDLLEGQ